MDTAKALRLIDRLVSFNPEIRLFGGEPLLHPDWELIVKYASSKGLTTTCVTNGTLLANEAEKLVNSGISAVGISLDGHLSSHAISRGKGIHQVVLDGIDYLHRLKKKYNTDHPLVIIYTTVHERNANDLVNFAHFLKDKNISWLRLQQLIWFTPEQKKESMSQISNYVGEVKLLEPDEGYVRNTPPDIDSRVLCQQIRLLKETPFPFQISFYPDLSLEEQLTFHKSHYQRNFFGPCVVIEHCSFVDPKGRLYPCMTIDMGNVFEKPFSSVWNGSRYRKFRRLMRRKERPPFCHRCPAYSYTGGFSKFYKT